MPLKVGMAKKRQNKLFFAIFAENLPFAFRAERTDAPRSSRTSVTDLSPCVFERYRQNAKPLGNFRIDRNARQLAPEVTHLTEAKSTLALSSICCRKWCEFEVIARAFF